METDIFNNINQEEKHGLVSAKEIVLKYLHYKWLFILAVLVALTLAWLYLRYTKPVYSVSSTLLIRNDNNHRSNAGTSSQDMFSDLSLVQSSTNKQNEILILSSRTMMERVVKSLDLQKSYSVVGNVKTIDVYPDQPFELNVVHLNDSAQSFSLELHFSNDWQTFTLGDEKGRMYIGQEITIPQGVIKLSPRQSIYRQTPYRDFIVNWRSLNSAALHYSGGLQVKPANDLSNVLSLTYIGENTQLATSILNELMMQYNNAAIEDKNETYEKIVTFITDRLKLVETQLDSVESNLEKYRTSRQVIDLSTQSEMYFSNANELSGNLRTQEVQLEVAGILEQYISQPSNYLSLVPSTLGLSDPTLLQLTTAYNKLVEERLLQLQTGATLNNPIVKNLERNIEEARIKMIQNIKNIQNVLRNNIKKLNAQKGSISKEISTIPGRERETREKARQQEVKQNLYLYLMQKREESEIAKASTISSSRIIDTALPTSKLVSPLPFKIYGIALLIGLILPIAFIYFRDLLNDKVTVRGDITKVTDAPLLAEVGHSEDEKVLLFPNSSRTIVAEQMRILRSNLRFVLGEKFEKPVILITSSFSGEGKSFISTNLGATLAISGKKTVILEFDLRKPKILEGLGLKKGNGLTNYLVGGSNIEELPQKVSQVENLYVVSCGPVPPNPSEILLTPKVDNLFAWLRQNFDAIIIDTAPAGLVSDSFALSQYADSTIYVIRQRYTYKRQLGFINELYKQKKLPNMGLLINDIIIEGTHGYYGYGSGNYGYGYGYGQQNGYYDKKEPSLIKKIFS